MTRKKKFTPLSEKDWNDIANKLCAASISIMEAYDIATRHYSRKTYIRLNKLGMRLADIRFILYRLAKKQYPRNDSFVESFFGKKRDWSSM